MKDITKVAIIGAGTMGKRIAFACVIRGIETHMYDVIPEALAKAPDAIRDLIEQREADGRLEPGTCEPALSLLTLSPSLAACASGVNMVIENVPENVELKRSVFLEIDQHANPGTLLGTNTSSIPGSQISNVLSRPEQFFNFNWGTPDDLRVEVMGNPQTSADTLESVLAFIRNLGLIPIQVKREIMGYCCNRIWRAVKKEVLFLLDGGYISAEDIDRGWMLEWETSLGPCMIMDMIGLDVVRDIEMNYFSASGDPSDQPPKFLLDKVEQGKLGVKSGEGFYKYPHPAYKEPGWLKGEES